jgi:hypothetical protein
MSPAALTEFRYSLASFDTRFVSILRQLTLLPDEIAVCIHHSHVNTQSRALETG